MQLFLRHPCFTAVFQHQDRDQRDQVGVAAAFTDTVDGSLNLPRPCLHRRDGVRHRKATVIMGVDADIRIRQGLTNRGYRLGDLFGHGATIGITENDPFGAAFMGSLGAIKGKLGVVLIAIKEMLTIEHRLTPALLGGGNRFPDHHQVFIKADPKRGFNMKIPCLADQAGAIGFSIKHGIKPAVIGGAAATPAGHPESNRTGMVKRRKLTEKGIVGGVGARPAPLNIINPHIIEGAGNSNLVGHCKINAACLTSIPQGGVK